MLIFHHEGHEDHEVKISFRALRITIVKNLRGLRK